MSDPGSDHAAQGLEVTVQHTSPCVASVSFTVGAEEFQLLRKRSLQEHAKRSSVKGFRPGKTPLAMIEKQYGEQVDREAIEHFLNEAFRKAITENGLQVAAHPRVSYDDVEAPGDGSLSHEFELWLKPEIELGEYKGLRVEGQPTELNEEELDQAMEEFKTRNSRLEPAAEEGLAGDGMAVCKVTLLLEGEEAPILERDGMRLGAESPPLGVDAEVYKEAMVGAKVGDSREFDVEYPEDYPEDKARGKKGSCRLELNEIYQVVVPTEEELLRLSDTKDLDALREKLRERIQEARAEHEQGRIENELLDQLIANHPMELPEPMLEAQVQSRIGELRQSLTEQEMPPDEIEKRLESESQNVLAGSARAMKAVYLMEEIAKAEKIQISEEDLVGEMRSIATRNNTEFDEVRKYYQQEGLVQQLALELLERKVRSLLRESADIQRI